MFGAKNKTRATAFGPDGQNLEVSAMLAGDRELDEADLAVIFADFGRRLDAAHAEIDDVLRRMKDR